MASAKNGHIMSFKDLAWPVRAMPASVSVVMWKAGVSCWTMLTCIMFDLTLSSAGSRFSSWTVAPFALALCPAVEQGRAQSCTSLLPEAFSGDVGHPKSSSEAINARFHSLAGNAEKIETPTRRKTQNAYRASYIVQGL